jgi:Methylase involved in ubiquinone/menaquinone biosynthesis
MLTKNEERIINKLESDIRVGSLKPFHTLNFIGMKPDAVFCDIGAGSGLFVDAALKLTTGNIFAVDISDDMRSILEKRFADENVKILKDTSTIEDNSCDLILLSTVMHELDDVQAMNSEVFRIMAPGGRVVIIEFFGDRTDFGPPLEERLSKIKLKDIMSAGGFTFESGFDLNEYLYCQVYYDK